MKKTEQNPVFTLGQFLKFNNMINSGGEAKYFLINNIVFVNDIRETRRGLKLKKGDVIKINDEEFLINDQ